MSVLEKDPIKKKGKVVGWQFTFDLVQGPNERFEPGKKIKLFLRKHYLQRVFHSDAKVNFPTEEGLEEWQDIYIFNDDIILRSSITALSIAFVQEDVYRLVVSSTTGDMNMFFDVYENVLLIRKEILQWLISSKEEE